MRLLALLAAAALAALLWFALSGEARLAAPLDRTVGDELPLDREPLAEPEAEGLVDVAASESPPSRLAVVADEGADSDEPSVERCSVIGTVVDANGAPIAGALVQLGAYRAWSDEEEAEPIASFASYCWDSQVGFELRTDSDGAFQLDVPVPDAKATALAVLPERFFDSHLQWFGSDRPSSGPALGAGTRDLGAIQLARTGAIFGRVVDEGGAPLEGVAMDIGPSASATYSRSAKTSADGSYVLAHAPEGTYGVKAGLDAYLREFQGEVTVELGRDTGPIDFVLRPAPTIEGRVVDDRGDAVQDARVGGWPSTSGRGAWTKTDASGLFTLWLPQDEPYSLAVSHDDFLRWGDEHDKDVLYEPGQARLSIELERAVKTRVLVVEDESGDPIERFGLKVIEDEGSASDRTIYTERRRPRLEDHPGGVVESAGRLGVDLYFVYAEGYLLAEGDFAHDEQGVPEQTIRLRRGASITGRAVRDGAPVAAVDATIVEMLRGQGSVRLRDNTLQRTRTDGDGRFTFVGLGSRGHRLTFHPAASASVVVDHEERLSPGAAVDLGDVELVAGGVVEGSVVVPAGVDPGALALRLDDPRSSTTALTDEAGRFAFRGVPAGEHAVFLEGRSGELAGGRVSTIDVESGRTTTVQLDLLALALVEIEIHLDLGGLPVEGASVELRTQDAPEFPSTHEERAATRVQVRDADADGVVRGFGRALGTCRVRARAPGAGSVEHPTARVELTAGRKAVATVAFELTSLEVELAPALPLPSEGSLTVELEGTGEEKGMQAISVDVVNGELDAATNVYARVEDGRLILLGLSPGAKNATIYAVAKGAPRTETDLGGGSFRIGPERAFERTSSVVLELDRRASLTVR